MSRRAILDMASLDAAERGTLERLASELRQEFGDELVSVWLYGSRARGEQSGPESDVDLLIVTRRGREEEWGAAFEVLNRVAAEEGARAAFFSLKVVDSGWIEDRRAVDSFFIQEVDRDKVVLAGTP